MSHSILFFCGQPLAATPIGQRLGAFGAHLRRQGWQVRLTSVDPGFNGEPFEVTDHDRQQPIEIIGPTHYRVEPDGRRTQLSPLAYLGACRQMTQRLRERAAEFVVLSTSLPATLFAVARYPKRGCRLWMDVDDWSAGQFTARGGGQLIGTVYGMLERWLPRRAHGITACSVELAGLYPGSHLVPNFIRLDQIPARRWPDKVRVAFASSITAYHGHEPLLHAMARRQAELTGIEFVFLGGGDALPACQRIAAAGKLNVRFTGALPRREMLAALAEAQIGVLPLWDNRLNRARFPLKLLDYLACGCAIAASDTGMAHEVLRDGETGLLSPAGDMDRLLNNVVTLAGNGALRERLSLAGQKLAREYDEETVCARWRQVLEK